MNQENSIQKPSSTPVVKSHSSNALRLVIFGPPGCGKGTQCPFLEEKYGIVHISTGDLLRKMSEIPGSPIKSIIDAGNFVSDEMILEIVENFISSDAKCLSNGFILDGFPRTLEQAKAWDKNGKFPIKAVIELVIPEDILVERVCGRLVHLSSGRSYHQKFNPPKVPMIDDVTGEPLVRREDDNEETFKKRLQTYSKKTVPLEAYYAAQGKLIKIDASLGVEETKEAIFQALSQFE